MGLPDPDRQAGTGQSSRHCGNRQGPKTVVVIDVVVPSDSNIRKKEYEKLEKYQGLKEELEGGTVKSEGQSGPSGGRSTQGCDS